MHRYVLRRFIISTALLLVVLCVAIVILEYSLSSIRRENQLVSLNARSQRIAQEITQELVRQLSLVRSLTYDEHIHALLGDGEITAPNKGLAVLEFAKKDLGASIVYVLNMQGTVVGSTSNPDLTNNNYAFRPYFTGALRGESVIYPAVGVTTHERGIYVSLPIYRFSTRDPIGVVVAKISVTRIDECASDFSSPVFITTDRGIVFATNKHEWLYRVVQPLPDELRTTIKESRQFADAELSLLPFDVIDGAFKFSGNRYYSMMVPISSVNWRLYVCDIVESGYPLTGMQQTVVVFGCSVFLVLAIIIWLLSSSIQQQKKSEEKLEASKQVLEDLVLRRSKELIGERLGARSEEQKGRGVFQWIRWHASLPMAIILCCGIVLSCMCFLFYRNHEKMRTKTRFELSAHERLNALVRSFNYEIEQAKIFETYFYTAPAVGRKEFKAFAHPLMQTFGGRFFAWAPYVLHEQVGEYEQRAHDDGVDFFKIHPVMARQKGVVEALYPIYFIEPHSLYKPYLGLNIASNQHVQLTIDTIKHSGNIGVVWTSDVFSDRENNELLMLDPVYTAEIGAPGEERNIEGLVVSGMNLDYIFDQALKDFTPGGLGFTLEFSDDELAHTYSYYDLHAAGALFTAQQVQAMMARPDAYDVSKKVKMFDMECVLRCFSVGGLVDDRRPFIAESVLIGGVLFSLVLSLYVGSVTGQKVRIKDSVAERTVALAKANQKLEEEVLHRKEIEGEMRRAKDAAESASNAKSDFLANMSHEIRTPMNAVIGFSDLLQGTGLTHAQKEYVETISDSGKMLLTLIDDILDVSKIEANRLDIEDIDFDLHYLVKGIVSIMSVKVDESRVRLKTHFARDMWKWYKGDPTRIRQVLLNLLSNAVKFTDAGEILVTVSSLGFDDETAKEVISLSVKDSGIGISKEKQQRIFDSFVQADSSVTRKFGGTGLGLTICRALVRRMGGDIVVMAEEGEGSEFVATLSFTRAMKEPIDHFEKNDWQRLKGKRVIIVAEDILSARIIEGYCKEVGIHVVKITNSVEDGMKWCLREKSLDFIFIDMWMHEGDGCVFAQQLYAYGAVPKGTHLIATSADTRREIKRKARQFGFSGYLIKPVLKSNMCRELLFVLEKGYGFSHAAASKTDASVAMQGVRVLVVEDNPVNMKLILAILNGYGCVCVCAYSGTEAIEKIKNDFFDLILMDLQMPDIDGFQVTQIFRTEYAVKVPIIALTAAALKEDKDKALQSGMNDYVTKPVDAQLLREKILSWVCF